jgi:ATP-binding cassette subfamily F protein uup
LLLARLFAQPSNLLVLDEPTNDLDAETLELLEELLIDYQGTLLLISHDRSFLNSVVTRSIVFERSLDGKDTIGEYAGGYDDWLLQRPALPTEKSAQKSPKAAEKPPVAVKPVNKPKKLSFKDQRELDLLPTRLEELEAAIAALQEAMSTPTFYQQSSTAITVKQDELAASEAEFEQAFARWEELERLSSPA